MEEIAHFFNSDDFMPHGHCFLWQPAILWLHVLSDAAIVVAYYAIPVALVYFVRKRKDIPFGIIFWLFGAFILLCGTTHLLSIWVIWKPDYALEGILKACTGIVSLITFFVIVRLLPQALLIPSPSQLAILNNELQNNIREREHAQKELQTAYDLMEQKVHERTEELHQLLKKLEQSNTELEEFAHIVSHDLKEPLRGLRNNVSFLLEDYKEKLGEDGVTRLHRLSDLCDRMQKLIDDLLYFSRLGHVELAIQETDPNQVITEIELMLEGFLEDHNALIIKKFMPSIVCDKPRITEVFRNLITNAIKYNDKPTPLVEVGFLPSVQTPHRLMRNVFYVKDNGIGIAANFHDDIFHIFKRLHTEEDNDNKSTGVGLTFVRRIVMRHGGTVWLDSIIGIGSTFYFTLHDKDIPPLDTQ